jgi:tetratricopeptide (TPR) repeat protein
LNKHFEIWPYKALFAILLIGGPGLLAGLFGADVLLILLAASAVWLFAPRWDWTGKILRNLARMYGSQGRYTKAESLYQRALATYGNKFGKDHLAVATELKNLAALYYDDAKYADAERLLRQARDIGVKAGGPCHPDVATYLYNLGGLYRVQGKYTDAEPVLKRALAIKENDRWPAHLDVVPYLNNLGELYCYLGNYAAAEPLYHRAIAIQEKALEPNHPDVAQSLNTLAELYEAKGNHFTAEPLYKRALAIWEDALAVDHPAVTKSLSNLALQDGTRVSDAVPDPFFKHASEEESVPGGAWECGCGVTNAKWRERCSGCGLHYADAMRLTRLAQQGIYTPLLSAGVSGKSRRPALWIPVIAFGLIGLLKGIAQETPRASTGSPSVSVEQQVPSRAKRQRDLSTWEELNDKVRTLTQQRQYAEAAKVAQDALEFAEQTFGYYPFIIAMSLHNRALLYYAQGNYAAAEPLYKRSLAIFEKAGSPDHPQVATTLENMAELYRSMGKEDEAKKLEERGKRIHSRYHPNALS